MRNDIEIIEKYSQELDLQDPRYLPGSFWKNALEEIKKCFLVNGISSFRKEEINLSFFVPTYGSPGNGFSFADSDRIYKTLKSSLNSKQKMQMQFLLDGTSHALADYRTFLSATKADKGMDLSKFSESKIGNPIEQFSFDERLYSRSALNYLLGLTYLKKIAPNFSPAKVLEIGGGFGTLGEIIGKTFGTKFKYIDLDLPPIFLIAESYIKNCFNNQYSFFNHLENNTGVVEIDKLPSFTFLPNWRLEDLEGEIDLFVNFISFQEMEPDIVINYVKSITEMHPKYILLRNLREGKQKRKKGNVGVKMPILKKDYLQFFDKYDLLGSNVLPFGFQTIDGFNSELLILKRK